MARKGKYAQPYTNLIEQAIINYNEVPAAYTELIDLGLDNGKNHLLIHNNLNEDVTIKFSGDTSLPETDLKEVTIKANENYVCDDFSHDGVIEIKHNGVAPSTSGYLQLLSW